MSKIRAAVDLPVFDRAARELDRTEVVVAIEEGKTDGDRKRPLDRSEQRVV